MLGHRKIDAEHARQMDQRMIVAAVRNVLDDRFAGVEWFRRRRGLLHYAGRILSANKRCRHTPSAAYNAMKYTAKLAANGTART